MSDKVRFNVCFSTGVYHDLVSIATKSDKSMSQVLRDALCLLKWAWDMRRDGFALVAKRGGEERELVLL